MPELQLVRGTQLQALVSLTAKGKCSHGTGRADAKSTQSGPGQQSKGAEKMIVTETERDGSPALESALQDVQEQSIYASGARDEPIN